MIDLKIVVALLHKLYPFIDTPTEIKPMMLLKGYQLTATDARDL